MSVGKEGGRDGEREVGKVREREREREKGEREKSEGGRERMGGWIGSGSQTVIPQRTAVHKYTQTWVPFVPVSTACSVWDVGGRKQCSHFCIANCYPTPITKSRLQKKASVSTKPCFYNCHCLVPEEM